MGNQTNQKLKVHALNAISEQHRMKTGRLKRLFNQFDSGNKGWLNKTDVIKMSCKALRRDSDFLDGRNNSWKLAVWTPCLISCFVKRNKDFRNAFDEIDVDYNGRISEKEFVHYCLRNDDVYEMMIKALD